MTERAVEAITPAPEIETVQPVIDGGVKPVDPFINRNNKFMRVEKPGEQPPMPKVPY